MSLQDNSRIDFIKEFYNRGLHNVLEEIVLRLPIRAILSCKGVNKYWHQIILFYHRSENPRIVKIQDERISEEWKKKTPIIYQLSLEQFQINQVSCFQIIGDEMQVIVAANINQTKCAKIIVIDADTFEVDHILSLKNEEGKDLDVLEIKVSMDEKILVAFVSDGAGQHFYQVWNRSDDYSENPQRRACNHKKRFYLHAHLDNIPFLQDGCLLISKKEIINHWPVDICQEWDLMKNTIRESKDVIPDYGSDIGRVTYRLKNSMIMTECFGRLNEHVKTLHQQNIVLWTIRSKFLEFHNLIGHNDDYVVFHHNKPTKNGQIVVYEAKRGKKILSFLCRKGKNYSGKSECQIYNNLMAFKGALAENESSYRARLLENDILILNLTTGEKIFSCTEYFGFPVNEKFLLQKGNIILEQNKKIVVAQFWP